MDRIGLVGLDWDNIMDMENRASRLERRSSYASKTLGQAFELSAARLVLEGETRSRGCPTSSTCRAAPLGRAAEYEADGEDAFFGSGNPVVSKDYGILQREREEKADDAEAAAIRRKRGCK